MKIEELFLIEENENTFKKFAVYDRKTQKTIRTFETGKEALDYCTKMNDMPEDIKSGWGTNPKKGPRFKCKILKDNKKNNNLERHTSDFL